MFIFQNNIVSLIIIKLLTPNDVMLVGMTGARDKGDVLYTWYTWYVQILRWRIQFFGA